MAVETLTLAVDVSHLKSKVARIAAAQFSSPITEDQLNELMKFVVIQKTKSQAKGSAVLYADIELPSDTKLLHWLPQDSAVLRSCVKTDEISWQNQIG